jgi:hypothetical protein
LLRAYLRYGQRDKCLPSQGDEWKGGGAVADRNHLAAGLQTRARGRVGRRQNGRIGSMRKLVLATALAVSALFVAGPSWADITILVPSGSEGDGLRAAAADYAAMKGTKVEIVQAP